MNTHFDTIKFNYYKANIKDAIPVGTVSLDEFIRVIRSPKIEIKEKFAAIKKAHEAGNDEEKARLKQSLYSFTPCVLCEGTRAYANITHFTGLMVLDFDKFKTCPKQFKQDLFDYFDFIHAAWLSASGYGVRAIVKIPVAGSVDEFKSYFNFIRYKHDIGKVAQFDIAPQNPVLPLFMSYDPELLHRPESKIMVSSYILEQPKPTQKPFVDYSKEPEILSKIDKSLSKITDCGHPILRAVSYMVGGYVGAGRISESEAISILNNRIEQHTYLSKKASIYKRTAYEMLKKGTFEPIYD